jgi:hypothetical protein
MQYNATDIILKITNEWNKLSDMWSVIKTVNVNTIWKSKKVHVIVYYLYTILE